MKMILIGLLILLAGCSSYNTSLSADGSKISIAKNKFFLFFAWGEVRVCDVKKNEIMNCVSNQPNFTSPYKR